MLRDGLRRLRRSFQHRQLDPITRAVVDDRLTYLSVDKLMRIRRALTETARIKGDLLEFGVALGGSGIILAHEASASRRFVGFDVFGMIPPPTSNKDDVKSKERYEIIKSGASTGIGADQYYGYKSDLFSEVKASFAKHGVPVDGKTTILHKGLFADTWPSAHVSTIALAHIDCDWYDPVMYCLESCADKMSEGGLIIIDDYNDYGGCRTAVDEFLSARSDFAFEAGANPMLRKRSAAAQAA